jgi:hypothetical protein
MILVGAIAVALFLQPASFSQAPDNRPAAALGVSVPTAGTEAALRTLVAGLASGSPDYSKLSPQFAEVVRRDLPMTQPLFSSMGDLKSITFLGRGERADDVYSLEFAKGGVIMSAALAHDGKMTGGVLRPIAPAGVSVPTAGTEAALRTLVAGLASGSPDYSKLSPQFAEMVRRDLPMTHPLFSSMGDLKSMTFLGRGERADDFYSLEFAKGGMIMSSAIDTDGRMMGGILQTVAPPKR